jgi:hypothetical protein
LTQTILATLSNKWLERMVGSDYFWVPSEYDRYSLLKDAALQHLVDGPISSCQSGNLTTFINVTEEEDDVTPNLENEDSNSTDGAPSKKRGTESSLASAESAQNHLLDVLSRGILYLHVPIASSLTIKADGLVPKEQLGMSSWSAKKDAIKVGLKYHH